MNPKGRLLREMDNGEPCPYHGLPVFVLVDEDPDNTWACDECFNHAIWTVIGKDGIEKQVFPKI